MAKCHGAVVGAIPVIANEKKPGKFRLVQAGVPMPLDNEAGAIVQCKGEKDIIDPGVDGGGAVALEALDPNKRQELGQAIAGEGCLGGVGKRG